jgi:hypothetical protein
MFEAKLVTTIRPSQRANTLSRCGPISDSDRGVAGAVGVGRVAAQQQQAIGAEASEACQIGRPAVDGRVVEAVVTGEQHRAQVTRQRDRGGVGDRMRHVHQLKPQRPDADLLARLQTLDRHVTQLVLVELGLRHRPGQPPRDDGRPATGRQLAVHPRHGADVVLVAVREDHGGQPLGALAHVGEVGQHEINAVHLGRREPHAGVDEHHRVAVLEHGHVLADLAQPAEREHTQDSHATAVCARGLGRRSPVVAQASPSAAKVSRPAA